MKATINELMGSETSYSVKSRFLVVYILFNFQISSEAESCYLLSYIRPKILKKKLIFLSNKFTSSFLVGKKEELTIPYLCDRFCIFKIDEIVSEFKVSFS